MDLSIESKSPGDNCYVTKLHIRFDLVELRKSVQGLLQFPIHQSRQKFSGWGLQSYDGNPNSSFNYAYANQLGKMPMNPKILANGNNVKTNYCRGYLNSVIDELSRRGLNPDRFCINVLGPGQMSSWHVDSPADRYCCALHIPIYSNSSCLFEYENRSHYLPTSCGSIACSG